MVMPIEIKKRPSVVDTRPYLANINLGDADLDKIDSFIIVSVSWYPTWRRNPMADHRHQHH